MNPALNGSSALEHFEHSSAIEIRNGILFNFYPGLPHVYYRYAQSTDAICTTSIVHEARYVVCLLTTHICTLNCLQRYNCIGVERSGTSYLCLCRAHILGCRG